MLRALFLLAVTLAITVSQAASRTTGSAAESRQVSISPTASAGPVLARDIREPKVEVRKLFDIVRDVWSAPKHAQQPFTYGSPPGREDFYFVAGK